MTKEVKEPKVVKEVKVAKAKQPVNKFINEYMIQANKTEVDKQVEEITMQLEDNTIECQAIIATLTTSDLPSAKLYKTRKELELVKAEAAYEKARFQSNSFTSYIGARNRAKQQVYEAKQLVTQAQYKIDSIEQQIKEYQSVLEDFQTTV